MPQSKHIVFIAGEESGDKYASEIITELKKTDPALQFSGIGGHHMASIGVELISDLAKYGVTGISEVIRHILSIKKAFKSIQTHLKKTKPDLLVLIDYPGFNLRLAKYAKRVLGLKILYYISPQVWAWKKGRLQTIKNHVDHMAVILPFEKKIYQDAGIPVSFVGHPLVERLNEFKKTVPAKSELGLPEQKVIIAMLPGSRLNEIRQHMPVFIESAKLLFQSNPNIHIAIPVAESIDNSIIEAYISHQELPYTLHKNKALDVAYNSDAIVCASGTASLECALLCKPMCIVYKVSLFTYTLASKVIKVKYLGLSNLLLNKMVVPELIQYDLNPPALKEVMHQLITNSCLSNNITTQLDGLNSALSAQTADATISEIVLKTLYQT